MSLENGVELVSIDNLLFINWLEFISLTSLLFIFIYQEVDLVAKLIIYYQKEKNPFVEKGSFSIQLMMKYHIFYLEFQLIQVVR
jgi:hypothetical protein